MWTTFLCSDTQAHFALLLYDYIEYGYQFYQNLPFSKTQLKLDTHFAIFLVTACNLYNMHMRVYVWDMSSYIP